MWLPNRTCWCSMKSRQAVQAAWRCRHRSGSSWCGVLGPLRERARRSSSHTEKGGKPMHSQPASLPVASSRIALAALAILAVLGVQASLGGNALLAQPLVASCPFYGYGYAGLGHGFYVTDYPSTNLALVTLGYSDTSPGQFSISLTAHRNAFDGPMIGVTQ